MHGRDTLSFPSFFFPLLLESVILPDPNVCSSQVLYRNITNLFILGSVLKLWAAFVCANLSLNLSCCSTHRSELTAQVAFMERSWRGAVAVARQNRTLTKEHLHQWRTYVHGSKRLWKLLKVADSFLPPAGPSLYTLHQLQSCSDVYKVSICFQVGGGNEI